MINQDSFKERVVINEGALKKNMNPPPPSGERPPPPKAQVAPSLQNLQAKSAEKKTAG
ncbi:hypothetical protein [Chlorobium sp. KB01]|uniref:hypothetical protein n=1 Tax=Chlorobium sp. KB01 TaxID=1917528 RepID=UPI001300F790|nr:hypothetical protein [Chlorobium sp. KB01]